MKLTTSSGHAANFPAVALWFRRSYDERVPLEQLTYKYCHESFRSLDQKLAVALLTMLEGMPSKIEETSQ